VAESVVLLKNENALLPVKRLPRRVHVAGSGADDLGMQCGGWTIGWQGDRGDLTLEVRARELPLSARRPTPEMLTHARTVLAKPAGSAAWHPNERIYAERVLQMADLPAELTIPLQAFRIGEVGIAAVPCEVFAETGLELKAKAPFAKAFTLEIANGYFGYLPTPAQHALGGYETWLATNRLEVEASNKIVAAMHEMWAEMKGRP
jgi:hypothetical protein